MKADGSRRHNLAWHCFAGLVMALQVALILRHDYFVDEWQALQLAVQTPDIAALFANLRYEGHPPLWHLLLRALAAVVGPHAALPVASLLLALSTQWLILFRSPFPLWLRLALALSEPILFEYGTVSRSYTLGVMLFFWALASWDGRRLAWLPLSLLPMTEFLFGVMAACLLLVRFGPRSSWKTIWWPGAAVFAVCSLFAAWTIIPAPDMVPVYYATTSPAQGVLLWMLVLSVVTVPLQWKDGLQWDMVPALASSMVLWAGFLAVAYSQTRDRVLDRLAMAGFLLVTLGFFAFLYPLTIRHMMLAGVLLVGLHWQQARDGIVARWPFRLWVLTGTACGMVAIYAGLALPFDTAPRVAAFIRNRGLQDKTWVSVPAQHGQGVSALTGVLFENAAQGCTSDFIRWNFAKGSDVPRPLASWVTQTARRTGSFHLLSYIRLEAAADVRELAVIDPGYDGKRYYIYRIGAANAPERAPRARCVSDIRPMPLPTR
ncbi:hypothetical protein GRI97_12215 [Altererythrobacter xixiisoli]|uniref:Glycosyltransferase RgtA/B/C/D-like domain-containing protein n=1 Tax=Croceibacterium xixiisoli TaxID=1476466 RepID=A0A6I4TZG6_9SPHN|nr:hypothetical protein [Croceibacterium xixiisoli]MXO99753.1 hypothetical protein [Croceibacterium xixiisoli]